jgi:cytochrome b
MKQILIWECPTRIFHWLLVLVILFSFYSGLNGGLQEMEYHKLSGYCALTLVIFRVMWGFVSRGNARFSQFVVGPNAIFDYLKTSLQAHQLQTAQLQTAQLQTTQPKGHNPLGGLSVIAMLTIILIQTSTGLFANDDIWIEGPLAYLVSEKVSGQLTSVHHLCAWFLGGLIILHLSAIIFHTLFLKHHLIKTMITGYRDSASQTDSHSLSLPQSQSQSHQYIAALILIFIAASIVYAIVEYL